MSAKVSPSAAAVDQQLRDLSRQVAALVEEIGELELQQTLMAGDLDDLARDLARLVKGGGNR